MLIVNNVDTEGLRLKHQGINSHSAEYAPMHIQMFNGLMAHSIYDSALFHTYIYISHF